MNNRHDISRLSTNSLERQFLTFLNDPYNSNRQSSYFQRQSEQSSSPYTSINTLVQIAQQYQRNFEIYQRNITHIMDMLYTLTQDAINNRQNPQQQQPQTQQQQQPQPQSQPEQNQNQNQYNSLNDFARYFQIPSSRLQRFQTLFIDPNSLNNQRSVSRLSNTQIVNNTRRIVYDASFSEPRCPVSLDDFEVGESVIQIISCGHYFKSDALMEWFRRNTHCPVCRYNLANPNDSSQTNDSDTQNNVRVETVDSDDDNEHSNQDDGFSEQFTFEIPIAIDGSGNAYLPPLSSENRTSFESEIEQTFHTILANALNEYLENR